MRNKIVLFVVLSLFSLVSLYASDKIEEYDLPVADESLFHIFRGAIYLYEDVEVPSEFTIPSYVRGEKVTGFDLHAFSGFKEIEKVVIPYGIKSIGLDAFEKCINLKWVSIPESVNYICSYAFNGCLSLRNLELPSSIIEIYSGAFSDCTNLETINIPASVNRIKGTAFSNCSNLNNIIVDEDNKYYSSIGGVLYNKNKTEIICCAGSDSENIFLSSVTKIGELSFYRRKGMKVLNIPDGVEIIYLSAFRGCEDLEEVYIADSVGYIAENVFENCKNLKRVNIPNSLKIIESSMFHNCISLNEITIPLSINRIKDNAFSNCKSLVDIYYEGSVIQWYNIDKKVNWHENVSATVVHCIDGDAPLD